MKKIFSLLTVIFIFTFVLTACGEKKEEEIKRYTIDDFPESRIMQTIGKVQDVEKTNKNDPKYKYYVKCDIGRNKFESETYGNYFLEKDDYVNIVYAQENNKFIILEMEKFKEPEPSVVSPPIIMPEGVELDYEIEE